MQKRTVRALRATYAPLLVTCLVACGERVPAADAGVAAEPPVATSPAPPPVAMQMAMATAPDAADSSPCPREVGLIADGENENRTTFLGGRGGYWYTYTDHEGSLVTPEPGDKGGTFVMTAGGAQGTANAARMTGTVGRAQDVFTGMGFNFVDPPGPYDVRKYKGISFWAKAGLTYGTHNVRLKLPDRNTHPMGNVCTECYNDFGAYLELTEEWTQYVIPFAAMKQQSDWGKPRSFALAADAVYGVQFQVDDYGKNFEIWVDEIEFTGCAP